MSERKEKNHKYFLTHKPYFRDYMRNWSRKNKNKVSDYHFHKKLIALAHYGGEPPKCVCCGETEPRFLTIDHINGDGDKHRRAISNNRSFSGGPFYGWLIKNNFPEGYQVMCSNCNMAKGKTKVKFCPVHHPELYQPQHL